MREPREHLEREIQWLCPRPAVFVLLRLPEGEAKEFPYLCFSEKRRLICSYAYSHAELILRTTKQFGAACAPSCSLRVKHSICVAGNGVSQKTRGGPWCCPGRQMCPQLRWLLVLKPWESTTTGEGNRRVMKGACPSTELQPNC